jgi:hypothetical protein
MRFTQDLYKFRGFHLSMTFENRLDHQIAILVGVRSFKAVSGIICRVGVAVGFSNYVDRETL